jgi:hypothetical protein
MNAAEHAHVERLVSLISRCAAAGCLVFALSLLLGAEHWAAAAEPVVLTVIDENQKAHWLSTEAISKLPRQQVTVRDRDGKEHVYEGPVLADVLQSVGVALGPDLRGARLKLYVTVTAADDYRVVYSLAELDPTNSESVFLLADRRDDNLLEADEGPYRIVVPKEKRRARWVRQVKSVTIAKTTADAQ